MGRDWEVSRIGSHDVKSPPNNKKESIYQDFLKGCYYRRLCFYLIDSVEALQLLHKFLVTCYDLAALEENDCELQLVLHSPVEKKTVPEQEFCREHSASNFALKDKKDSLFES